MHNNQVSQQSAQMQLTLSSIKENKQMMTEILFESSLLYISNIGDNPEQKENARLSFSMLMAMILES